MRAFLCGVAGLLALASVSGAQSKQTTASLAYGDRLDPFRGIRTVSVLVEELPSAVKGLMSEETLKAAVEQKLRRAGLAVEAASWGMPTVYVNVNSMLASPDVVVHSLELQFTRNAAIHVVSAQEDRIVQAIWWSRSVVGIARKADTGEGIRGALEQLIDLWLTDWLAANRAKR